MSGPLRCGHGVILLGSSEAQVNKGIARYCWCCCAFPVGEDPPELFAPRSGSLSDNDLVRTHANTQHRGCPRCGLRLGTKVDGNFMTCLGCGEDYRVKHSGKELKAVASIRRIQG